MSLNTILRWDTDRAQPNGRKTPDTEGGTEHHREGCGGSSLADHDPERARKGPMHPAMARWYEIARYTQEQVAGARRQTAVRKITGKRRPPVRDTLVRDTLVRDTLVRLPRWTPGQVVLVVALTLVVAVVLCLLAYAMRTRAGAIGTVGDLVTWSVWWLEAALYAWAGALAADWVIGRRRQLEAHLRGED